MSKTLLGFVFFIALALSCVSCGGNKDAAVKWTIGMSQCNLAEPWREQMNADIKKAADAHPEIKIIFKDAQNDALKQVAQVEEFVAAGVNRSEEKSGASFVLWLLA